MSLIPEQFRTKEASERNESSNGEENNQDLAFLFNDGSDDGDGRNGSLPSTNHSSPTLVEIGSVSFLVQQPPDKGTLFAHQVWSGSRLLAQYILDHPGLVQDKSTIEFGAGTALPSLAALKSGSRFSMITDYPDEEMLQSIRETVGHNWYTLGDRLVEERVAVHGHEWGSSTENLLQAFKIDATTDPPAHGSTIAPSTCYYYDVALLSECLWNHSLHEKLAASLHALLHHSHGRAIVTYAHHIPGLEEQDDAFFTICQERYGLQISYQSTHNMSYMWDSTKTIPVLLKVLVRGGHGDSDSRSSRELSRT
ncbi:hypothetical protein ACA910_015107 [Epithemia clementina (nom. ined.)]